MLMKYFNYLMKLLSMNSKICFLLAHAVCLKGRKKRQSSDYSVKDLK